MGNGKSKTANTSGLVDTGNLKRSDTSLLMVSGKRHPKDGFGQKVIGKKLTLISG